MPDPLAMLGAILGPYYQNLTNKVRNYSPEVANFLEQAPIAASAIGGRAPNFNLGGRQVRTINQIEDWLSQSRIPYNLQMNRSGANSVYINATHPTTGEQVAVRVPKDQHIGYVDQREVAKYKDTNRPGNFYDTGNVVTRTDKPVQPEFVGNVSGEPYSNLPTLFDALSHRFSTSPEGFRLVSPGREPYYPQSRLTPIPLTQSPINWGTRGIRNTPPESVLNAIINGPKKVMLPPRQLSLPLPTS